MTFEAGLLAASQATGAAERAACLSEAAARYQADLLPGHFEDWVLPERQRLREAFLTTLSRLSRNFEEEGDLHAAIEWARRAAAADPLREEAHHDLIRVLLAAGQPAAAVHQYHELERLLSDELGTIPSPETRALISSSAGPLLQAHTLRSAVGPVSRTRPPGRARKVTPMSAADGSGGRVGDA
jgi:DNA-binding SARP family transcriptional activator